MGNPLCPLAKWIHVGSGSPGTSMPKCIPNELWSHGHPKRDVGYRPYSVDMFKDRCRWVTRCVCAPLFADRRPRFRFCNLKATRMGTRPHRQAKHLPEPDRIQEARVHNWAPSRLASTQINRSKGCAHRIRGATACQGHCRLSSGNRMSLYVRCKPSRCSEPRTTQYMTREAGSLVPPRLQSRTQLAFGSILGLNARRFNAEKTPNVLSAVHSPVPPPTHQLHLGPPTRP
jgi:hypothetical protein